MLLAGGQGTRLEHPGPKGTFSFDGVSLFELQARQILNFKNADGELKVHWYIMTVTLTTKKHWNSLKRIIISMFPKTTFTFSSRNISRR